MRVLLFYNFIKWFTLATNPSKLLIDEMALKNYSLISDLTSGNECNVFLFQNTQNQNDLIINKMAKPRDFIGMEEIENEKNIFEILASIPDYKKYVIGYYGSKIVDSSTVLEIEYAPGKNLVEYLRSSPNLNDCDYANLGLDILEAVNFLHSNGIAHLGLYARNIFVKNVNVKIKPFIGDFGKSLNYYNYLETLSKNLVLEMNKRVVNQETKTIFNLLSFIFKDSQLSNYFLEYLNDLPPVEAHTELPDISALILKLYKSHFITVTGNQCEIFTGNSPPFSTEPKIDEKNNVFTNYDILKNTKEPNVPPLSSKVVKKDAIKAFKAKTKKIKKVKAVKVKPVKKANAFKNKPDRKYKLNNDLNDEKEQDSPTFFK